MSEAITGADREKAWEFLARDMKLRMPALIEVLAWTDEHPGEWYPGDGFQLRRDGRSYSIRKK